MLKSHTMIGLIFSVPFEGGLIKGALERGKSKNRNSLAFAEGVIGGKKAALICSGIGIANAALAVAVLAERRKPDAIVLFGIGGAYRSSGLRKGDVAAAQVEIYAGGLTLEAGGKKAGGKTAKPYDGFRALGFPLLTRGRRKFFGAFPLEKTLLEKAGKHVPDLRSGRFLTVCETGRPEKEADLLGRRYGAIVENMEGAGAAQAALLYGIPLLELRGISNIAGEPPRKWLKEEAALNCQQAVLKLLEYL